MQHISQLILKQSKQAQAYYKDIDNPKREATKNEINKIDAQNH